MPDAVSFRVTTYRKLARGETRLTQMASNPITASEALDWVPGEVPGEAGTARHPASGRNSGPGPDPGGPAVTRQEFVDAVAEVIGMRPGIEEQVGTIVLLGDAYAATRVDAALHPECRCGCGRPVAYKRLRLAESCYARWRYH